MKVSSKASAALSLAVSSSSFGRSTRSILLRTASRGLPVSPTALRIDCVSSVRLASSTSLRASIRSMSRSASAAAPQAEATIARSRRRLGANRPGVSTNTICASPRVRTPRTVERVVCALRVTIETFSPTSALIRVDLPALGAPMMATNPHRVSLMSRPSGRERPAPPPVPRPASSSRRRLPARSRRARPA